MSDIPNAFNVEAHHYLHHTVAAGGLLPFDDKRAHALWHYAMIALCNIQLERTKVVLIGELSPEFNYKQLFSSVARQYGVEPHEMQNCWPLVDRELARSQLPAVPKDPRYRGQ